MKRLYLFRNLVFLTTILVFTCNTGLAFDGDTEISDVQLFNETFLDINALDLRKSLDLMWYETLNGWRHGGGSKDNDSTFLQTHLKINRQLSEKFYAGFDLEQDDFYAKKPLQPFLLFADIYPFSSTDIGFSILGTTSVEKKESDLGLALTFGRRPVNYLRLSWLSIDHTYNDKNDPNDSYYVESAETLRLQSFYKLTDRWDLRLDLKKQTPLEYLFEGQTSRFKNESYNYKTTIIYHFTPYRFAGIDLQSMSDTRSLQDATSYEAQEIDYQSANLYWVNGVDQDYELTVGLRYDNFEETLRSISSGFYDFLLETIQAYSALYHNFSIHQAWDLGLYVGWTKHGEIYTDGVKDIDEGIEAKLRTSWEYHSIDKTSRLLLSLSFNLDDLIDDPTDGIGLSFQTQF